ncbi:MAG TPA: hypothetical protein DEO60_02440 [Bacteroidales bacterium]|nr:hypothetical protein [Bacteroidales bacterium]
MKHLQKTTTILFLAIVFILVMQSCKKLTPPVVTTFSVSEVTQTTAVSGGNVKYDGGAEIVKRGICWEITKNPTTASNHTTNGTGTGSFISNISGLTANTIYYVRAWALNSEGMGYGNEISFTTSPIVLATLSTTVITSVTFSTAVCGGSISFDGGGPIIERGVCWAIHQNPTKNDDRTIDGIGTGSFTSEIKCLSFASTYYVRAYATNTAGTAYGDQQSFTTPGINPIIFNPSLTYGTVTDIEGNCYKTIQIGTQIWMAENLKTTKYNDGNTIPNITDDREWKVSLTGAYCWYDNNSTNKNTYGALYNWEAVNMGNLCPTGWHVPGRAEYVTLTDYLGGESVAGGKLKESGTTHWNNPNNATNESGFTALPAGNRFIKEGLPTPWPTEYRGLYEGGIWWFSDTPTPPEGGVAFYFSMDHESISTDFFAERWWNGCSVRCIKN